MLGMLQDLVLGALCEDELSRYLQFTALFLSPFSPAVYPTRSTLTATRCTDTAYASGRAVKQYVKISSRS